MEADSGGDVNIVDEHQFKAFINTTNDKHTLTNSTVKLRTLQHKLEVEGGDFQTVILKWTCGKATRFFMASGRIHSPPMISKETLTKSGKLRIQPHGCFKDPFGLAIFKEGHSANTVKQEKGEQDMKDLTYKYSHLFQGTGKIKDKVE